MKKGAFTGLAIAMVLLVGLPGGSHLTFSAVPQEPAQGGVVPATPELIRQVQFMLQTIGIDPGPIDGNAQALTNRAAHQFQFQNALPITDITNSGPISTAFLDLLRKAGPAPGTAATRPFCRLPVRGSGFCRRRQAIRAAILSRRGVWRLDRPGRGKSHAAPQGSPRDR